MSALTQYRRPGAGYKDEVRRSPWVRLGGWHLWDDGRWTCVYALGGRVRKARRAVVFRSAGAWVWRVEEFSLDTRKVMRIANRSGSGVWYVSAEAAMPWADAAAKTSD